jgi:hypothetical protein
MQQELWDFVPPAAAEGGLWPASLLFGDLLLPLLSLNNHPVSKDKDGVCTLCTLCLDLCCIVKVRAGMCCLWHPASLVVHAKM